MAVKVKVTVEEYGPGFGQLINDLEVGEINLGVQGEQANAQHPKSDLMVGQIAAIHELGMGVPERSWCRSWIDQNQNTMQADSVQMLQNIIKGESRKKEFTRVSTKWVNAMRENIAAGNIRPPLSPVTIAAKGHGIPLLETTALMNAITARVKLYQAKSIKNPKMRGAVRARGGTGG